MFKVGDKVRIHVDPEYTPQSVNGATAEVFKTPQGGSPYFGVLIDKSEEFFFYEHELELLEPTINGEVAVEGELVLNPEDPFERVLIDMVETNRRKRKDYAIDGSPFSNFDDTAQAMGIDGFAAVDSALFNIHQKLARLRSLRLNGRTNDTQNEAVVDTYLDLAVYGVIALAIHRFPDGKVSE